MFNTLAGRFGGFAGTGGGSVFVRFILIGENGSSGTGPDSTSSGGVGGSTVYTLNTEEFTGPQNILFRQAPGDPGGNGGGAGGTGYFMSTASVTPSFPHPVPSFRPTIIAAVGGGGGGINTYSPAQPPSNVGGAGGGTTGGDGVDTPPAPAGNGGTQSSGGSGGSGGGGTGGAGQFLRGGEANPDPGGDPGRAGGGGGGGGYYGGGGGGGGGAHHSSGGGGSGHSNTVYTYYHSGVTTQGGGPSFPGLSEGIFVAAGSLTQMNQPFPTTTLTFSPIGADATDKIITINKDGSYSIG